AITTTPAASALFSRFSYVDCQGTSINACAIEGIKSSLSLFGGAHRDKTESARTAANAVHHQVGFDHGAVGGKSVLKTVFSDVEGKISNKQFIITHVFVMFCRSNRCSKLFPTSGFQIITKLSSP